MAFPKQSELKEKYAITIREDGTPEVVRTTGKLPYYTRTHGDYLCVDGHELHKLFYVYFNGDIPDGYVVYFVDGDINNITLENLKAISRSEFMSMQRRITATKHPGRNQYSKNTSYEEILKNHQEKQQKREDVKRRKEERLAHQLELTFYKEEIIRLKLKLSEQRKVWKDLCQQEKDLLQNHQRREYLKVADECANIRSEIRETTKELETAKEQHKKLLHSN